MKTYTKHARKAPTPQTEAIPGRETEMTKNHAGGVVFALSPLKTLERFLILGTEGGTYYASEREHTKPALNNVTTVFKDETLGLEAVRMIVDVSDKGRAVKNDPAIYALALALCSPHTSVKQAAANAVVKVCRTGTHLFQLVAAIDANRGWGRIAKRAVNNWYQENMLKDKLTYQLIKYRQREGWTHRDVLRKTHFNNQGVNHGTIDYFLHGFKEDRPIPYHAQLMGFHAVQNSTDPREVACIVRELNLPWEAIPTEMLREVPVWEALLESGLPMTAMVRNLGRLSNLGLLNERSQYEGVVLKALADEAYIRKSRLHPLNVLIAQRTYANGHGDKGSLTWNANRRIVDALEAAFYKSFENVEPTGKRFLLGVDVSGSMSIPFMGKPITYCEAAAIMAMVALRTEPDCLVHGFTDRFVDLKIGKTDSIETAVNKARKANFGRTDCAMPMVHAMKEKIENDVFCVYTDNETYAGSIHPSQALVKYRKEFNIPAKLAVFGMAAYNFSIADPKDPGMMDFVGFDASSPAALAAFVRQEI